MKPRIGRPPLQRSPHWLLASLLLFASSDAAIAATDAAASADAVKALTIHLENHADASAGELTTQPFASVSLTKTDTATAQKALWESHARRIRAERSTEIKDRVIHDGDLRMPFAYDIFGEKPAGGRSLFISMHLSSTLGS